MAVGAETARKADLGANKAGRNGLSAERATASGAKDVLQLGPSSTVGGGEWVILDAK